MGNQTGVMEEDSGVSSHQSFISDSIDLSDMENGLINCATKKIRKDTKDAAKSSCVAVDLRARLDSSGLAWSSSEEEEEDENVGPHETNDHKTNFTYSNTWSANNCKQNLKLTKSLSTDLTRNLENQPSTSYSLSSIYRGMEYIGKITKNLKVFYNDINSATLTGAIDAVVVEQEDGSFKCSPFHVRFGKLGVIRSKEILVDIEINGEPVDLHMRLGQAGEAYFLEPTDSDDDDSSELIVDSLKDSKTMMDLSGKKVASSIETAQTEADLYLYESKHEHLKSKSSAPIPINSKCFEQEKKRKVNFFSDGEITPEMTSPTVSRPSTPKSDTEYEIKSGNKPKRSSMSSHQNWTEWNWSWGQLPERQNSLSKKESDQVKKELSMGEEKTRKRCQQDEGKYLDELNDDDALADLYLNNRKSNSPPKLTIQTNTSSSKLVRVEDDQESGRGISVPQSPRDTVLGDIQLSLCGSIASNFLASPVAKTDSTCTSSQNNLMPSSSSSSLFALSPTATQSGSGGVKNFMELSGAELNDQNRSIQFDELFQQNLLSWDKFVEEMPSICQNPNLVLRLNGRYMNWSSAGPIILANLVYQKQLSNDQISSVLESNLVKSSTKMSEQSAAKKGWFFWSKSKSSSQTVSQNKQVELTKSQSLLTQAPTAKEHLKEEKEETMILDADIDSDKKAQKYRKTTRLSSDQIKNLKLRPGLNQIKYSVTTALQGTTKINSYIFLWNYDDKIIVSDIDGTITKSDVWGQVLPLFGRDWTQTGVADLFTAIEKNEYKFIYLSARAIGQSTTTRNLLTNVNQNGFKLPYGPLLITPTSLFTAFHKEVIERKPEEFKIQCLKDIQQLFPSFHNPFHAGYGNRTNDVTAYKAVNIDVSRIFTINPQGEIKHEVSRMFQSSYSKLCDFVDLIFPPYKKAQAVLKPEYDTFNYWRNSQETNSFLQEIEAEINKSATTTKSKETKETKKL
ncbi:phosphatidate phosphatase LPIN3 [Brachionus plicatilis]|uniref:phosphatidate phosphatase n=1 Tax=Brachionus plicatilis TaxID=10195 RepID=A0A3M7PK42_BRAPC|nr:phosphatidate phosphatase LPIN3 [Brachionus plicatilis]